MLISFARTLRRHPATKLLLSTPRRLSILGLQKLNSEIFAIEIEEERSGFFAVMQLVMFVLKHCEEKKLIPYITARGGLYGEPTRSVDWFGRLFVHRRVIREGARRRIRFSRVRSISDLGFRARYETALTLPMATGLFHQFFEIAPDVVTEVAELGAALRITSRTLAVHFRGTDKRAEARVVEHDEMIGAIRSELRKSSRFANILLATDEIGFRDALEQADIGVPVICAPMRYHALAGRPVHFSGHPGLEMGREALITCLLLARSGMLIKTASYLSAWAKIFNPELATWLLSDSRYFPDHAIWLNQSAAARD